MTDRYAQLRDPDVRELARLATRLHTTFEAERSDPWGNNPSSPFSWIKSWPSSKQVGKVGENLVAAWCESNGFSVRRSPDLECDRIIGGHRMEIKFSTLWKGGVYKFQQIRDQDYAFVFALGVSPFDAHAWVIPKGVLSTRPPGLRRQHGGARGTDTDWLSVTVGHEHEWMNPYGGTLAAAREFLVELGEDRST